MTADLEPTGDAYGEIYEKARLGHPLTRGEVMTLYGYNHSAFYNRRAEFDLFKLQPAIGTRIYSGVLVYRHLTGQPLYEPTWGRKTFKPRP